MKYIFIFTILSFISCNHKENQQTYSAITNFTLDTTAAKENDGIKVIFASEADDANPTRNHLIQFIGINLTTKDTINILCFRSNFLKHNDGNKIFHFKSLDQEERDRISSSIEASKILFDKDSAQQHKYNPDNLIMVAYDPKFKNLEDNIYPTVIGELVTK